jgi:hypothetical protein
MDSLKDSLSSLQTDGLENSSLWMDRLEDRFTLWIDQLKDSFSIVARENRWRIRHQLLRLVVAIGREKPRFSISFVTAFASPFASPFICI